MLVYVAHRYGCDPANIELAKKITHDLQVSDLDNCYICPLLTFSHLKYGEIKSKLSSDLVRLAVIENQLKVITWILYAVAGGVITMLIKMLFGS